METGSGTRLAFKKLDGRQLLRGAWGVLAILFCVAWLAAHWNQGVLDHAVFNAEFYNGTFQLLNPLRRIQFGKIPTEGLLYFHGPWIPFILYPFYCLHPTASFIEFLKSVLPAFFFLGSSLVLFTALVRGFFAGGFLTLLLLALPAFSGYFFSDSVRILSSFNAQASIYGVRTAAPFLVAAFLARKDVLQTHRDIFPLGLLLAFAIGMGTEHGLASLVAVAVVLLFRKKWAAFPYFLALAGNTFLFLFLGLCLFHKNLSGALGSLKYNLVTIPANQFWFFGVPPAPIATSWLDWFSKDFVTGLFAFNLSVGALWLWLRFKTPLQRTLRDWDAAILFLFGYAALSLFSLFGIHASHYTGSFARAGWVVFLLLAVAIWRQWELKGAWWYRVRFVTAFVSFALAYIFVPHDNPLFWRTWKDGKPSSVWSAYDAQVIPWLREIPAPAGRPLIQSTYASYIEDQLGLFPEAPTDYIIHALGPKLRRRYFESLQHMKPEIVQTLWRKEFLFEEWLQTTMWPFYKDLLENYDFAKRVRQGVFWVRRKKARSLDGKLLGQWKADPITAAAAADKIPVPLSAPSRYATVTIEYDIRNPLHWFPILGKVPRYLLEIQNAANFHAVTLPPMETKWTFPIIISHGASNLEFSTHPIALFFPASVTVRSLSVRSLPDDESTRILFEGSEGTWPGIARLWSP